MSGTGTRAGEAEAVEAALVAERARTSAVSVSITEDMIAAAYPIIAAAVRAEERERLRAEFADLIAEAEPVICADEDRAHPVAPPTLAIAVVDVERILAIPAGSS